LNGSVLELIKKRRSVRKFKSDPIPPQFVESLKEALIWAPSAGNLQARKFIFVFNPALKSKIADTTWNQRFVADAPLVVVGCVDHHKIEPYGEMGKNMFCRHDLAASIQNLLLTAVDLGLGAVWMGAFDPAKVSALLDLPPHLVPEVLVPVGFPAENPAPTRRISLEEIEERS